MSIKKFGLYIHGSYVHAKNYLAVRSPFEPDRVWAEASVLENLKDPTSAEIFESTLVGLDECFKQVQEGFFPLHERLEFLRRLSERIANHADALAQSVVQEIAKPISYARLEVWRCQETLRWTIHEAPEFFKDHGLPTAATKGWQNYRGRYFYEARGPLFAITPFNFPLNLVMHKLAPAIAAGCPILLKPSPKAVMSTLALVDLCHAAGLPAGMLCFIPCSNELTKSFIKDRRIKQVSFTGSSAVGWQLRALAPEKPFTLELGGTSPQYVDESADIAEAARECASGAFAWAGQSCIALQNIFVHKAVFKNFKSLFAKEVAEYPWGHPSQESVKCATVIDQAAANVIQAKIKLATQAGAKVFCEAGNPIGLKTQELKAAGSYIRPQVFIDVPRDQSLYREEIFAPLCNLFSVDSFKEWRNEANSQPQRLQAALFTRDNAMIEAAVRGLDYGSVIINQSSGVRFDPMPYGGRGEAGMGREGPRFALQEFCDLKAVLEKLR